MIKHRLLLALAATLFALGAIPALAVHDKIRANPGTETEKKEDRVVGEDAKLDKNIYKPDYCDFFAKFPTEPLKGRRCETDDDSKCYDLVSFTKVFGLSSTVRFDIICNPADEQLFAEYTPEVMKKTVIEMTKGNVLESYEPQVQEEKNYRLAGIIGRGRAGMGDTIFVAQLWVGKKSIMAVEAEMMGEQTPEADDLFASILKTIGYDESPEEKAEREKAEKEEAEKQKAEEESKTKDIPAPPPADATMPKPNEAKTDP